MIFYIYFPEDAELTPLLRLGAGACAGIIAMSATYPMDLVRGRLTVQVLFKISRYWHIVSWFSTILKYALMLQTDKSPNQYRGIAHALRTVLREEGPRALYKGWVPSVIGVVSLKSNILLIVACYILYVWRLIWSLIFLKLMQYLTRHSLIKCLTWPSC